MSRIKVVHKRLLELRLEFQAKTLTSTTSYVDGLQNYLFEKLTS